MNNTTAYSERVNILLLLYIRSDIWIVTEAGYIVRTRVQRNVY